MKILIHKILYSLGLALAIILMTAAIKAQPPEKALERIEMLKKNEAAEILDLDDASADKFLVKYSSYENQLKDKKRAVDDASEDLKRSLRKSVAGGELSKKTEHLIQLQVDLQNLYLEKLKGLKPLLSEEQYAKYVVFEARFAQELRKNLFKMFKDKAGED